MRPGSIDEVLSTYASAIRKRRDIEDRMRIAVAAVQRLEAERDEQTKLIRELREDVRAYAEIAEVAA